MPARKNGKKYEEKPVWRLFERVGIRYSDWTGRIVEFRGPLGGNGAQVYRIELRPEPDPSYIEVREDQLIRLPPEPQPPSD
jgi:hypothetical protein